MAGIVDFIRQKLIRRGSIQKERTQQEVGTLGASLVRSTDYLSIADRLLLTYFMAHLPVKSTEDYLRNGGGEIRKKLIMADLYTNANAGPDIAELLGRAINMQAWTIYIALSLKQDVRNFVFNLYVGPQFVPKRAIEQLAEDALYQYVAMDFNLYRPRIRTSQQAMVVLCDNLLQLPPPCTSAENLRNEVYSRLMRLNDIVDAHNIDISKEGANALYLLQDVEEFKESRALQG